MENNRQQILLEMSAMLSSIKQQIEQFEEKLSALQQEDKMEIDVETSPIDIMLPGDLEIIETIAQSVVESEPESLIESEPVNESEPIVESEPVIVPEPEAESEQEPTIESEEVHDDIPPSLFDNDLPTELFVKEEVHYQTIQERAAAEHKTSMLDAMMSKQSWRTDVPGTPVKDVIGAIALMDRVDFINKLFGEQPLLFKSTLDNINHMESFEKAVEYLIAEHPEWDMDSDVVYRFMMAVRRKLH